MMVVKGAGRRGAHEVELVAFCARRAGQLHKPSGGIDLRRRADGGEQIGLAQGLLDLVEPIGHFAKPNHIDAQVPAGTARRAGAVTVHGPVPRRSGVAGRAPSLAQLPVHMDEARRAAAFVQIVDVLRDQGHVQMRHLRERGQGDVRRVGRDLGALQGAAASVVEAVNQVGVARKPRGRADIF